jgi:hypothetical protein
MREFFLKLRILHRFSRVDISIFIFSQTRIPFGFKFPSFIHSTDSTTIISHCMILFPLLFTNPKQLLRRKQNKHEFLISPSPMIDSVMKIKIYDVSVRRHSREGSRSIYHQSCFIFIKNIHSRVDAASIKRNI